MTVVFVHGNPETAAIWGPLVSELGRDDVVLLSPPGFGAPLPADFPATHLAYRDWLETELGVFDEPIDLVGHNWGGGHVLNAVMHQPELVHSWASDVLGIFVATTGGSVQELPLRHARCTGRAFAERLAR